jgi:hypothetical protein
MTTSSSTRSPSTTSSIDDFHPNTSMVDLNAACPSAALFLSSSTSTIVDESVLFLGCAAAPLSTPDIKHSEIKVDMPIKQCLKNRRTQEYRSKSI